MTVCPTFERMFLTLSILRLETRFFRSLILRFEIKFLTFFILGIVFLLEGEGAACPPDWAPLSFIYDVFPIPSGYDFSQHYPLMRPCGAWDVAGVSTNGLVGKHGKTQGLLGLRGDAELLYHAHRNLLQKFSEKFDQRMVLAPAAAQYYLRYLVPRHYKPLVTFCD